MTSVLLGIVLGILPLNAGNLTSDVEERNPNPKGIRVASKDSILEPDQESPERTPIREYYLVDRQGKRCSGTIEQAILPLKYDNISVQWLDRQNSLVVVNNRHKFFQISAFVKQRNGFYGELHSKVDDDDALEKLARALFIKAKPDLAAVRLKDDDEKVSLDSSVDVDSFVVDDSGVVIPVQTHMINEMKMEVLYKFDHSKLRFIRQKATLLDSMGKPILSLSGTELDKMMKK
jgi:hypothetical protein